MTFADWAAIILARFGEQVGLRVSVFNQAAQKRVFDASNIGTVTISPAGTTVVGLQIQASSLQTGNLLQAQTAQNSTYWAIDANQYMRIGVTALPATTGMQNGQALLWWDQATGYMAFIAKNNAGALKVGRVTMS